MDTISEQGWSTLVNGDLLAATVRNGYDVFVTTDQNTKHQQNLADLHLGILVLLSTSWPRIRNRVENIVIALDKASQGILVEVPIIR